MLWLCCHRGPGFGGRLQGNPSVGTGVYCSRPQHINIEQTAHQCMPCPAPRPSVCVCVCRAGQQAWPCRCLQAPPPTHYCGGGSAAQAAAGMQRPASNGLPGSSHHTPTDNRQRQQGPWRPAASCSVYVSNLPLEATQQEIAAAFDRALSVQVSVP